MTVSMTGFASREGAAEGWTWTWELRSVNGRGLDIRTRLPDWPPDLEAPARAAVQKAASRGNVTLGLRLQRESGVESAGLNAAALTATLALLRQVEERALAADLSVAPPKLTDILTLRGVLETDADAPDPAPLRAAILADLTPLIAAFVEMRRGEGAALAGILGKQIDTIAGTVAAARALLPERALHMAEGFRAALARVVENADGLDAARVAQEIAVLAVKADVAEELDRLEAHVATARGLLAGEGARGRKLDFLTQEFNREANTLCAKAGYPALTRLGLDLKHTIDQMREQVQNVE